MGNTLKILYNTNNNPDSELTGITTEYLSPTNLTNLFKLKLCIKSDKNPDMIAVYVGFHPDETYYGGIQFKLYRDDMLIKSKMLLDVYTCPESYNNRPFVGFDEFIENRLAEYKNAVMSYILEVDFISKDKPASWLQFYDDNIHFICDSCSKSVDNIQFNTPCGHQVCKDCQSDINCNMLCNTCTSTVNYSTLISRDVKTSVNSIFDNKIEIFI